jgi:aminoglycoside/choline kinase family phosphotransferase
MLHNQGLYFIDFQGGRRGPLQYDLASLLFEAKTDLQPDVREILLEHYLKILPISSVGLRKMTFLNITMGMLTLE